MVEVFSDEVNQYIEVEFAVSSEEQTDSGEESEAKPSSSDADSTSSGEPKRKRTRKAVAGKIDDRTRKVTQLTSILLL